MPPGERSLIAAGCRIQLAQARYHYQVLRIGSTLLRMFLVVTLLAVTVVSAGAVMGPQISSLKGAVNGRAGFDISLAALDTRSLLYDSAGNEIFRFVDDGSNRELLALEDMPEQLITAVVTIEDAEFFSHPGINLRATFRALVENVGAGGISQGGSTISQQLIKNRVLTEAEREERSIPIKIREAVLSWRMEDDLAKGEILEAYLNSVYFGAGAYGVQAAAEVYFDKDATDLDWPETALLAALISSPGEYDPFINPSAAQRQRQIVFNRLVDVGAIDEEEARFYNRVPLPSERNFLEAQLPEDYYVAEVRRRFIDGNLPANLAPEVIALVGDTQEGRINGLFRGGLRIFTTYDSDAQREAENARDSHVPADFAILPGNTEEENETRFTMAIAAIEPGTGAVRALVGGPRFEEAKFNLATQGDRQPGSSFKTFVLIAALEAGYVPNDTISGIGPCLFDNPGSVDPIYTVNNFGNSGGSIDTLVNQVTRSSNCGFVRLGQAVGIPNVIETANRLGLELDPVIDNNKSLPLGATEVRPLEVASAYATIANGGVRHEPYYIDRIEDASGNVLYEHEAQGTRVLGEDIACLATQVLEQNVIRGTGTRAQVPNQPAGGKTGTTENFSDAWFVGFTPQLATSVWMGNPQERVEMRGVGGRNVTGGSFPAQAWGQFMTAFHEDLASVPFPECTATRAGRLIREDGDLVTENPCAVYPGYSPTDTNNDGTIDQCIVNPGSLGYVRCGVIDTGDDGLLEQYCQPGGGRNSGNVNCGVGTSPIDINGDGRADTCSAVGQQQQDLSSLCDPGYNPTDTNGDGVVDVCVEVSDASPPPRAGSSEACPPGFPYGADTNSDGTIDTCYANPVP